MAGFLKLVSPNAKATKPCSGLYNPPIHQSEWPNKTGPRFC